MLIEIFVSDVVKEITGNKKVGFIFYFLWVAEFT